MNNQNPEQYNLFGFTNQFRYSNGTNLEKGVGEIVSEIDGLCISYQAQSTGDPKKVKINRNLALGLTIVVPFVADHGRLSESLVSAGFVSDLWLTMAR